MEIERDSLEIERDSLEKERNSLEKERNSLEKEKNSLEKDRNSLEKERNSLEKERNSLEKERNSLEKESNSLEKESNSWGTKRRYFKSARSVSEKDRQFNKVYHWILWIKCNFAPIYKMPPMKKCYCLFLFLMTMYCFAQKNPQTLGFIENKGQIVDQKRKENKAVQYLLNTNGLNVQLRNNGFSYDLYETKKIRLTNKDKHFPTANSSYKDRKETPDFALEYHYHRIDIDFLNSNTDAKLLAEEKSSDYDNYYNVAHAPQGITNVHKYQRVTYQNIYNNIDAVFFIPKDSTKVVEYNFVVRPGGKVSDIQMKFKGAKTELTDNKIKMTVRFGQMEETLPLSWIENGNSRKEIKIGFRQLKKNVYGFEGDITASNRTIVIDPTPVRLWGTYYGGGYQAFKTNTVKTDNSNNVIFTGLTYSSNNVGTSGAFQSTGIPIWETGFIAKMNSIGVRIWGTYVKNNTYEARIYDLAINSANEIYAVGYTWDQDGLANTITTPGSFKEFGSAFSREGMIIKFSENGQRIWGTFYGGENFDEIRTTHLDSEENLIIAGQTRSTTGISTSDGFISNNPSPPYSLGFFSKFNPNGIRLYGSYFQGEINFCNIDNNDNVYFAGQYFESDSYPNITTSNAHQTQCNRQDIFIVKFNSNFNREWCTYYGGNESTDSFGNSDRVTGLGSDSADNIYVIGTTSSANNIATPGSFKETQVFGGIDAFIVKFNSLGTRQWGTYFGGNSTIFDETGESGCVSPEGNIYIAGNSRNYYELLSTPNSFQPTPDGSDECFFAKFNSNGDRVWGSYYGTPSQDFSGNIYYKNNNIYLLGFSTAIATNGNDLGTPGTHMPSGGGFFLAKFQDCVSAPMVNAQNICENQNLELSASGGTNYSWTGPNGFTSNQQNPIITNANAAHSGIYTCTISGTGGCDGPAAVNVTVGDTLAPIANVLNLPTINGDCTIVVSSIPTATDNCAGTILATTVSPLNYSIPGSYTIVWNYNDGNGNTSTQNQTVVISAATLPTLTSAQQFCIQQNATLNNITITGQNIKWYDAPTGGNLLANTTLLQNGITYYASQTINGCESARVPVTVTIQNTPAPTGNTNQSFCSSQNATLADIVVSGSAVIWYNSANGSTVLPPATILASNTTYYASQTLNGCESPTRVPVTVTLINTLNANDYTENLCDDQNDGVELVNLSDYNSQLISPAATHTFSYFSSRSGAENQSASEALANFVNYPLHLGTNIVFVRIDSPNGCHQVVQMELILWSKPIIPITEIMAICEGSSITVSAGTGYDSYQWSTMDTTSSISISSPGNYSVTVAESHGTLVCSSVKNFTVVHSNIATVAQIITADWTYNQNTITVLLTAGSSGDYVYSLDGINYQASNTFTGLHSGEYLVYIKDKNGCGIKSEDVYLLMYPKFFTPNGDGHNDLWSIKFSENEPALEVHIFDRYGKLLGEQTAGAAGWDGMYLGKPLPSSDYWFLVKRQNGKEYRGHFTLKR